MDRYDPRQHPTAGGPLSLLCGVPGGSFLLPLSCCKALVTTLFVPACAAGRGRAGGHDVPPGPAPPRLLPDRPSIAQASLGWYLRCKWPVLSHCPVLSRRSWWGGEGRCRQPQDPSICSLLLLAALGSCHVCESGIWVPPGQWGSPGPLGACPSPHHPWKMPEGLSAGQG